MPARPRTLSLPADSPYRAAVQKKFAQLEKQLPGMVISNLTDFGVACRLALISILLDYPQINTAQARAALLEANPDFGPFFAAEPLVYDSACADVARWCRGLDV